MGHIIFGGNFFLNKQELKCCLKYIINFPCPCTRENSNLELNLHGEVKKNSEGIFKKSLNFLIIFLPILKLMIMAAWNIFSSFSSPSQKTHCKIFPDSQSTFYTPPLKIIIDDYFLYALISHTSFLDYNFCGSSSSDNFFFFLFYYLLKLFCILS